jgi:hypothetical protein
MTTNIEKQSQEDHHNHMKLRFIIFPTKIERRITKMTTKLSKKTKRTTITTKFKNKTKRTTMGVFTIGVPKKNDLYLKYYKG